MDNLIQTKGCRWFQRLAGMTLYSSGFRSKADASKHIDQHPDLEWRAGFVFKLYGDDFERMIVSRKGVLCK